MLLRDTIEFAHVALGLVPEILDTVDVIMAVSEQLGMVDPVVVEGGHVQHIIAAPAVGIDDAVGHHFTLDNRHQGGGGSVGNDLGVNLSAPL